MVLHSMAEPQILGVSNLLANSGAHSMSVENARQRAMQAVEYYHNSILHRSAMNDIYKNGRSPKINGVLNSSRTPYKFGTPDVRSSYNERCSPRVHSRILAQYGKDKSPQRSQSERNNRWARDEGVPTSPRMGLYRSNSSLDLEELLDDRTNGLRREYGSASSIDVMSTTGESFFAMLRDFRTENTDQRSPGPPKIADYLRGKIEHTPVTQNASNTLTNGVDTLDEPSSPKLKMKFQKLWDPKDKSKMKAKTSNSEPSIFRKFRGTTKDMSAETSSKTSDNSLDADKAEEKLRRKAFAHYDIQSITANLSYAAQLRSILSRRRNTTTGASAASMSTRTTTPHGSTEDLGGDDVDIGDGRNNELILSCPFFRNELGGEEERVIYLTRITNKKPKLSSDVRKTHPLPLHKPNITCGLSVLENTIELHWRKWNCPYHRHLLQIENVDHGVSYYKQYFHGRDHQNWFGIDENLGPLAISLIKEKVEDANNNSSSTSNNKDSSQYQYRLIIRTSELSTLRGTVLEDAIPTLKNSSSRGIPTREILDYIAPELQLSAFRLGISNNQVEEQLLKLDHQGVTNTYKVGIMYCKAGQATEEEMYNNEYSGPAFDEFLEMLGERVRLKGFDKYRAQLDNKTDSTGFYSVYSTFQDCEIMFHVSTMLPYTPNNRQQLLRKRHIGNDIVTIVFQEPDALPFTPKNIRSHFQHVFIVVRAINPCTENTRYKVAISRSKEVPVFGPPLPEGVTFPKSKAFADFLLAKIVNAENAAHKSEKFATMATRTRQEYLKDLASNYVTTTTMDAGPKFSMLSFGGRKKERSRPRFIPDATIRGAIVWQIQADDFGQSTVCDCFLGISMDTLILIEENTREPVFACSTSSILGWSSQTSSLKIYYHQGECIVLRAKDPEIDEIQEIVSRLNCVTQGCETQEFTLRRNSIGQLGFHVQHDGTITEVENYGFAWQAGLRHGSRLVEICKAVVSSLTHDQMVDLLKTSVTVTVTVIPPLSDGNPRRGCDLQNCTFLTSDLLMDDYEHLRCTDEEAVIKSKPSPRQRLTHNQIKTGRCEPNASPPRSVASSGYGSGRSVATNLEHRFGTAAESQITSSSSQSSDEKWYDLGEMTDSEVRNRIPIAMGSKESPPPPLPARFVSNSHSAFSQVTPKRREPIHSFHSGLPSSQDHGHSSYNSCSVRSYGGHDPHSRGLDRHHEQFINSRVQNNHATTDYATIGDHCLADYMQHDRMHPIRGSATNRDLDKSKMAVLASPAIVISDGHSDSSSDRLQGARSEDEQSGSSNSLSPRSRRRWPLDGWGTGSSGSSRNQSPRMAGRGLSLSDTGEAKLRPGINNRQANRNSSHCSSTFQEDLLKLINPDLINVQDEKTLEDQINRPHVSPASLKTASLDRSSSRDNLSHSHHHSPSQTNEADVIFTTARPATVISTTSSSPAPSENKLTKEERLSPRSSASNGTPKHKPLPPPPGNIIPLPNEAKEIDWPSLVDTATKAMQVVGVPHAEKSSAGMWINNVTDRLGLDPFPGSSQVMMSGSAAHRIRELEARVKILEQELARERHRKAALEVEVRSLREENLRLQEESQTAAQQLRRFTEWFFRSGNELN